MGLDGKEAEIWNPQPSILNTGGGKKQEEAKKVKREAHAHNTQTQDQGSKTEVR